MIRRRPDGEHGAVAIVVAVTTVLLVAVAAFAVDLGMQRVLRRDMQALADVAALDLARTIPGKTVQQLDASAPAVVRRVLAHNSTTLGDSPDTTSDDPQLTVEFGRATKAPDGSTAFVAGAPTSYPDAVRVTARNSVGLAFASGRGGAARTAIGVAESSACYSMGSYAARVRLGDSMILGPLLRILGTSVDIDLLDLQGLAGVDIKLLDLIGADLGAATFDELLDAEVTLGSFYLAVARALEARSGKTAQVALLENLARVALPALGLRLGDLLDLGTAGASALAAEVNVLDLVTGAAFLANGDHVLSVPNLNVNLAGITQLGVGLTIGQKPTITCGRAGDARGESSQITLTLAGNLAKIDLGLAKISAPISIKVSLNPSEANLSAIVCQSTKRRLDFLVTSGLLGLDILVGSTTDPDGLKVAVAGINIIDGYIRLSTRPAPGSKESGSIVVTDEDYGAALPLEAGKNSLGVPYLYPDSQLAILSNVPILGDILTFLLGGIVNGIVTPLVTLLVNPLVAALDRLLLSPLLQALGLNVSGADIRALSSSCGEPSLRG